MTVEGLKTTFDWMAVILLFLTFAAGAGVLITGNVINRRQEEKLRTFDSDLTTAKSALATQQERAAKADGRVAGLEQSAADAKADMAKQQERAATAERELLQVRDRVNRQQAPRWVFFGPLGKFLIDKTPGSVEVVFAPEDDEAQKTAMWLDSVVGTTPNWKNVRLPHPYSEVDIISRFLTPEMRKNVFHSTLFERVGGLGDITVIISPADIGVNKPLPGTGTAAEALWRGLIACGFQALINIDEKLTAGSMRVVVGPKR
jgi:hypothetical protein